MLFARKLLRELWSQKGQAIAVLAVTSLGVLLFVATAGAYRDLRDSYANTRERLALAALHIDTTSFTPAELTRVRSLPSVARADARVVASLPVEIGRGAAVDRVQLRVLSLPDAGEPILDRVLLLSGGLPSTSDEVLLEKHLAQHHGLHAGDTIAVAVDGLRRPLRISGVAVSAEYLWVARDEHDVFPSPDAFGVGWMRRRALSDVARAVVETSPRAGASLDGIVIASQDAASNQLLVDPSRGTSERSAIADVGHALGEGTIIRVTPAAMLVGPRLLQMDVDGYKGMAAFFPFFFLGVAAFIVASILGRLVDAQRSIIGTFAALGVSRARLLTHYLTYAVALAGFGSALGAVLGVIASPAMTREYAVELGIPFVSAAIHFDLVGWGVGLGLLVGLVSGFVPAWHASRLAPAEAMRPPRPSTGPLARMARGIRAPLPVRLAVRDLLGKPLRSVGTALGVAAALVLVLSTGAMLDSMRATFTVLFHDARRYDLRIDLVQPEALSDVLRRFESTTGVARVEAIVSMPVSIRANGHVAQALADGIAPDARLLRSMDMNGQAVLPRTNGIVITRSLARSLGVRVGDPVYVSPLPLGSETQFRVSGLADGVLGATVTARREDLQQAFGLANTVTTLLIEASPGRTQLARRALSTAPDVAHIEDASALRSQVDEMMSLGWAMLALMLACSVVLATAILFNTATLGILERRRDFATLRALGRTVREIGWGLTLEHGLLAVLGLLIGFPMAVWTSRKILALYSSDLFTFPFVLAPRTVITAVGGIFCMLIVAQWPALRQLARMSLAEAVRSRES